MSSERRQNLSEERTPRSLQQLEERKQRRIENAVEQKFAKEAWLRNEWDYIKRNAKGRSLDSHEEYIRKQYYELIREPLPDWDVSPPNTK